jgi:hypothetical protein
MPAGQPETSWFHEWILFAWLGWARKTFVIVRHSPVEQTPSKCEQWLNEQNWNHNQLLSEGSGYLPRMMKWSEEKRWRRRSDTGGNMTICHSIISWRKCANFVLPRGLVKMSSQLELLFTFNICRLPFRILSWKGCNFREMCLMRALKVDSVVTNTIHTVLSS